MVCVAITGYASLDHVVLLDGVPTPGRTTTITKRPAGAWPRLGGAPAYVAAALVEGGIADAFPVTWIGEDASGADFRRFLEAKGARTTAVATVAGASTPMAVLAYEPSGGCLCLYHPAIAGDPMLTPEQRDVVASADWLCVTVGPKAATSHALNTLPHKAGLCWIVKDDPRVVPPALAERLAARADLICCSSAEAPFVAQAIAGAVGRRGGQILIETHGGKGATIKVDGKAATVPSSFIEITDPTGAGDTFAGGALAALVRGERDPVAIVEAGHQAARNLLMGRLGNQNESA